MRAILGCGVAAILMCSAGLVADDKKDEKVDAKKLIGKWEPAEAKKGLSMVVEFAKEGKLSLAITFGDKTEKVEGTYKVAENKIDLVLKIEGKEEKETLTILKLTDDELSTEDSKGKKDSFKKVKK